MISSDPKSFKNKGIFWIPNYLKIIGIFLDPKLFKKGDFFEAQIIQK